MEENGKNTDVSKERLFIALALPESLKLAFGEKMKQFREELPFKRWVHPMDLHVTLQFLGDVPKNQIAAIDAALLDCAAHASCPSLRVGINGLGVFGRPVQPSVLWAGIDADMEKLGKLQQAVVEAMKPLGFIPEQRSYKPHLTLARNYAGEVPFEQSSLQIGEGVSSTAWNWQADAITLYRSNPRVKPSYEAIGVHPLVK